MRSAHNLTRSAVSFDEAHLLPHAGLMPAAAPAQRIDLPGLVDQRVRLPREAANSGTKALTVIRSILAGGDSTDDTDLLQHSSSVRVWNYSLRDRDNHRRPRGGRGRRRPVPGCPGHVP